MSRDRDALREQSRRTKRFELRFTAWHNGVTKPVIAAVNGVCAGGGLHFVADADVVIAAADADVPRPARVGRAGERVRDDRAGEEVADGGGAAHGVHRPVRADVGPARAYELGIVSEVVDPPERLRAAAQELAERIAQQPPAELAAAKRALWDALERTP